MQTDTGEKPFSCEICIFAFSASYYLKKINTRPGEKPLRCEVSGSNFLQTHMQFPTGK